MNKLKLYAAFRQAIVGWFVAAAKQTKPINELLAMRQHNRHPPICKLLRQFSKWLDWQQASQQAAQTNATKASKASNWRMASQFIFLLK